MMKIVFGKTVIVLCAIAPFIWLSLLSASMNGERTVTWTPGVTSPFIMAPLPAERVSPVQQSDTGAFVTIQNEPVYFGLFPPSDDFTSVDVTLAFHPKDAFAVELGGMTNVASYAFDFRGMSNNILEHLSWKQLPSRDDNALLFVKQDVKASLEDFLAHQPSRNSVVTYRATLPGTYREPDYSPISHPQTFNVSLRGSHEYVTYIKNETLNLTVQYQDINRTFGADEGYVRVYSEDGTRVVDESIVDDGNTGEDQTYSMHTVAINKSNLPEGVYRVELSGTSDIVWRKFTTSQRYMSFKNTLYIADDVGYLNTDRQTDFVTNSKSLALETFHAESAHSVTLGSSTISIPQSHVLTRSTVTDGGVVAGKTSAGDVKIVGEGKFALSKESFFDPDPRPLTAGTNLDDPAIQYVYASVSPIATDTSGWRTATTTFNLASLVKEGGAYKLALSLPGFHADLHTVDIHSLTATFHKAPISFWTAIKNELRRWKNAIIEKLSPL